MPIRSSIVLLNKKEAQQLKFSWSKIGGEWGRHDDQECTTSGQKHRSYKLNNAQLDKVKASSGRSVGKLVPSKKYGGRRAFPDTLETSNATKRGSMRDESKIQTPRDEAKRKPAPVYPGKKKSPFGAVTHREMEKYGRGPGRGPGKKPTKPSPFGTVTSREMAKYGRTPEG